MEDLLFEQDEARRIVGENLTKYRKNMGLTQLELADRLLYSDKNISKWERGEALPDAFVLKKLADMYGIKIDDFFVEGDVIVKPQTKEKKSKQKMLSANHLLIILLSTSLVWLVACILSCVFMAFLPHLKPYTGNIFLCALPISFVVMLVFTSIWCTNLLNAIVVGGLIWTTALAIFLCIPFNGSWLLFIVCVPLQILDILWFTLRKVNKKRKILDNKNE